MNLKIGLLSGVAAVVGVAATPSIAQTGVQATGAAPQQSAPPASGDIIVTARRTNERLQDVPIAVSVVAPATIAAKGVFTPVDLMQSAPGLSVTASVSDRNNLTYTIRGQGFSYGTIFPAVVTYFNEVPITQLTAGQFFDLANVQVLRGPQGVSFGRVTDGGNVMVAAQDPKNSFGGYFGFKLGNYNLRTMNGAINIPIVADKILLRAATEISRRDGFTKNINNDQDLDNVRYESYRVGLTLKPTDTLTNTTTFSYQRTHDNGTSVVYSGLNPSALAANIASVESLGFNYGINSHGDVVPAAAGLTPFTAANYVAAQEALLAEQKALGPRKIDSTAPYFDNRKNLYLVNTTTANITDDIQLKNIFGYVNVTDFEASNYGASNGASVLTCHSACGPFSGTPATNLPFNSQKQLSEELRLSGKAFDNNLTWSIGGYMDRQKPGRAFENDTINVAILERDNVQYATTKSRAVYGSAEYDLGALLPGLKVNGGVRYTHDSVSSSNATYLRPIYFSDAAFNPIPHGQCTSYLSPFGNITCITYKAAFNATTWTGGVSYKPQGGPLLYAKISKGYRPGGVNGSAPPELDPQYNPEFDTSVEIGVKADFRLGGDAVLRTNVAAYHDHYAKIQKTVIVPGAVPVSVIRNVDNGTIQGVELDASLTPFRGLNISGTFAYTDAKFSKKLNFSEGSCDPTAPTTLGTADQVGFCPFNLFNSVPKTQFTVSASYDLPIDADIGKVTLGANYYHQSKVALTDTSVLNPNAIEPGYGTLDLNVTWSSVMNSPMDLSFFMTNVTNKLYRIGSNDLTQSSSIGVAGNIYAAPRMFGASLKYRFGSDAR